MIVVGATCVGSIQFVEKLYKNDGDIELKLLNNDNDTKPKYYDIKTNVQFSQNEELGNFNFGGSTIIYIIPKEDVISTDLTNTILSRSRNGDETSVVVGQDLYNIEDKLLNAPLSSTGVEQGKYNIISNIDDSVLAALQR
jgi:hypothetical protein